MTAVRIAVRRAVREALRRMPDAPEAQAARDWLKLTGERSYLYDHASTGASAHNWALVLRDEIEKREIAADYDQFPEHGQGVLRALGVRPL